MTAEKRRVGRPGREPKPGERVPLGLRVTPELKRDLDDAANRSGRSQSQEAEMLLAQALRDENRAELFHDVVFGRQIAGVLEILGRAIRNGVWFAEAWSENVERTGNVLNDPILFDVMVGAVQTVLNALRPSTAPTAGEGAGEAASRGLLMSIAASGSDPDADEDEHARFGRFVRAKIGNEAAGRIPDYFQRLDEPEIARLREGFRERSLTKDAAPTPEDDKG
jgi:hypothetical protein